MKKWLSYWLVILIALQSIAAIVDAHQSHQSGEQHLTFEHEHAQTPYEISEPEPIRKSIDLPNDGFDCHHCCHCHLHLTYLPAPSLGIISSLDSLELSRYDNAAPDQPPASLFRPPKV